MANEIACLVFFVTQLSCKPVVSRIYADKYWALRCKSMSPAGL